MVDFPTADPTPADAVVAEAVRTLASIRQSIIRKPFREMEGWRMTVYEMSLVVLDDGTDAALLIGPVWHPSNPDRSTVYHAVTASPYVVAVVREVLETLGEQGVLEHGPIDVAIVKRGRSYTIE